MRSIAELQRRFVAAVDLGDFWNDFLDQWAMDRDFMELGEPAESRELEALSAHIVSKMYGREVKPETMRLLKIEGPGVVHGAFHVDGQLIGIIYFEQLQKGLIAAPGEGTRVYYARFTCAKSADSATGASGLPN
jgi:predicted GNAT superfamily acetyltransferase